MAGEPPKGRSGSHVLEKKWSNIMARRLATIPKPSTAKAGIEPNPDAKLTAVPHVPERRRMTENEIRLCAYRKWVAAGRPIGDGVAFWLEAERELKSQQ